MRKLTTSNFENASWMQMNRKEATVKGSLDAASQSQLPRYLPRFRSQLRSPAMEARIAGMLMAKVAPWPAALTTHA
ncbi:MAG: hypothetical protein M3O46_04610, partial [Myxococcota bacterium]|nr:hypothetical protein [Myxococcota bacterium]